MSGARVREARITHPCTRACVRMRDDARKMRDRPSQGWDTWQRVQIFKEESTESHFPWPIYPSLIIECFDDAYLTPCRHFASSIGFREKW